jgi:hypothetical protein
MTTMNLKSTKRVAAHAGMGLLALAALAASGESQAQQLVDPSFEVFRIRCQIDVDVDPATGLETPKVQIQVKARSDLLETVDIWVERYPGTGTPDDLSSVVSTYVDLGTATADWDTFPDGLDPAVVTVPGDFVVDGDQIQAHARDTSTYGSGQQVTDVAKCATKTSSQFRQQTKPLKICDMPDDEDKYLKGDCVLQ